MKIRKKLKRFRSVLKKHAPMSVRDWIVSLVIMALASFVCAVLAHTTTSDTHVPLIFVLAVLVVSLMTEGYFYGLLAAIISVLGVNFAFTFPYMKLDFSIYGYPLTFLTMLAVGFAVCTLTTRLQAQEKLRMDTEKEKMRANLLRAISHDLRTPLTAISGNISTVLEDDGLLSIEQEKELLTDAKHDAEWLCRMVENLLSITRISGETRGSIRKEDELLEEVLSEAVAGFKKRHEQITVKVSVPEEMLLLPMDAMLIEQVLLNIMDNAVSHGDNTSRIDIHASLDGKCALISIEDDGCGIDADRLPHLFDGSLQFKGRRTADDSRGMGIGLSVCKTIIEAHGGEISAANTDIGAKFTFTLPLGGEDIDN